jgi:hypothetical protein
MRKLVIILLIIFVLSSGCSLIPSLPPVEAHNPSPPVETPPPPPPPTISPTIETNFPSQQPTPFPLPAQTPSPTLTANLFRPLHHGPVISVTAVTYSPHTTVPTSVTSNVSGFAPIRPTAVVPNYIVGTWDLENSTYPCDALFATGGNGRISCGISFIGESQPLKWANNGTLDDGNDSYVVTIEGKVVNVIIGSDGKLTVDVAPDGAYFVKTG